MNHVLDGGPDPCGKGPILRGKGHSIVKYRDYRPCAAMWPFSLTTCMYRVGQKKCAIDQWPKHITVVIHAHRGHFEHRLK